MDRTLIGPWKKEEKELSETLFLKLRGLTLMYPPSEEFRKCLSDDMFVKSNLPAFFQVMNYLFRLLDPVEFKKRFFWPIVDKRSEAVFRSSTVDYMKHLSEKHQLHWANIKSYLVVQPGGMKFITFMLNLVSFVIRELTRDHLKQHPEDSANEDEVITKDTLNRMRYRNTILKKYASTYIHQTQTMIATYNVKTYKLIKLFKQMAVKIKVPVLELVREPFHAQFEASNRRLYATKFASRLTLINSLEQPLVQLRNAINLYIRREGELKYDKDAVRLSLQRIGEQYPQLSEYFMSPRGNEVGAIVAAFSFIYGDIKESMVTAAQMTYSQKLTLSKMLRLNQDFQQLHAQLVYFKKSVDANQRQIDSDQQCRTPASAAKGAVLGAEEKSNLMMKVLYTPPIKVEMCLANSRLPLFEGQHNNPPPSNSFLTNCRFLAVPSPVSKHRHIDTTHDPNTTLNKSQLIDPMDLLRTIKKKSKPMPKQNLSAALGAKECKTLYSDTIEMMPGTNESHQLDTSATMDTILGLSPISTPYSHKERTRIARSELVEMNMNVSNDSVGGAVTVPLKKFSAVKKVQNASLNIQNISTSPSGRLDPLVAMGAKDIPKLQLNDGTINIASTFSELSVSNTIWYDQENDPNRCSEEDLFNTSDTVLKDITM